MCVLPALTYGAATWSLTKKLRKKLSTTQNAMRRSMLGVRKTERLRTINLKKLTPNLRDINTHIRNQKWGWAGHIARMSPQRLTYLTTFWSLPYSERVGGRPKLRWKEEIDKFLLHKNFHQIACNRTEWERVRYTFALLGPGAHSFQRYDRFAFTRVN